MWGHPPPDISDHCSAPPADIDSGGATSGHEDTNQAEDQPLLAHIAKKKPLLPGDIKCLLSPNANTNGKQQGSKLPHEFDINGVTYHEVNIASITYSVSSSATNNAKATLVDHGANGGIAGEDIHVIAKTGKQVDIQGIDNHRITNIPIVTAGEVVNTQHGQVIAIMHQYACTGKGKTIHSCAQLESHKQIVHDKSIKVGGNSAL
ncbi:MAG TPA: hypothetical protein V6D48_21650 [Oculatellaceae cyanobacterium]